MVDDDELSALLREVSVEIDRAEARRLAVVAEWARRQAWANDGAYNGRCWLAPECTLSRAEAAAVLKTARVVASAPVVAEAVASGALPVAKAEVLASVVTSRTEVAFVRDLAGPAGRRRRCQRDASGVHGGPVAGRRAGGDGQAGQCV